MEKRKIKSKNLIVKGRDLIKEYRNIIQKN